MTVLCGVCGDTVDVRHDHQTYDAIDHALDNHRELLLASPERIWFYIPTSRATPTRMQRERQ